jgi:hypothetical protein
MARFPGPSIVTPSPTNRSASVQAAGGESAGRAGWYGAGGICESAKRDCTVAMLVAGWRAISTIAWRVSVGAGRRGGAARSNSVVHAAGDATQAASMLARELNERRVSV